MHLATAMLLVQEEWATWILNIVAASSSETSVITDQLAQTRIPAVFTSGAQHALYTLKPHAKYDLFAETNWTHAPYAFCAATYKSSKRLHRRNFCARIKMCTSYTKSVFPNSMKKGRLHRSTGQTFVLRRDSAYRRSYDPRWRPKPQGRSLLMHVYLDISLTGTQEPRVLKLLTIRH